MPETMIKSCWGKRPRRKKVRAIWKPRHCGDVVRANLWIAQLHQSLRRIKFLRTFFSLLLSQTLQQGELKETVSMRAHFPVPFVGMTYLTDDTIRVFTLFFAASSKGCSKAKCPFIEMLSVQIGLHREANLVLVSPICSGAKLVLVVVTNLNTDVGAKKEGKREKERKKAISDKP